MFILDAYVNVLKCSPHMDTSSNLCDVSQYCYFSHSIFSCRLISLLKQQKDQMKDIGNPL